jgi:hypothetical protein
MHIVLKALCCTALVLSAPQALAYTGYVSTAGKDAVIITVTGLPNAQGWGAHFSTASSTDGYGGYDAECHLTESSSFGIEALCYDGYQDASNHVNQFRMSIGPKADIEYVRFTITRREVRVDVLRRSTNGYTSEVHAYTLSGTFPLRQTSGFWRGGTIYYQTNGNLANVSGRSGSGYQISSVITY